MKLLVTGSSGLIGSEVVTHFDCLGWDVHGVDNNMRADFFGPAGDTRWNQRRLESACRRFTHHEVDLRDRAAVLKLMEDLRPTLSFTRRPSRATTWRRRGRLTISTSTPWGR